MHSHLFYSYLTVICLFALAAFSGNASAQYTGFGDPGSGQAAGTGAGLVPVETDVDGGTIPIGATGQVVLLFRNEGGQPVQTGVIQLYPSSTVSATVESNQCNTEELPSGAECAIAVSVKGLQAGPWRVEMLMAHSGRTRLVTATVSGTVESTGDASDSLTSDVEAIPDEVDFGSLEDSQTLIESVILRNITSVPINISDVYIEASESSGYKLSTECAALQAGQACIATVTWSPQSQGRSSGVLVVKHDGPAGLSSVPLKGEYSPEDVVEAEVFPRAVPGKGLLVASQKEIQFEDEVSTASAITVSLVNTGDTPLLIKDILLSSSDNGLSFKESGCAKGITLDPIEACPLTIAWSPTRVGSLFDDVQVLHNGARGILVLPVRGTATGTVSQDQKAIVLSEAATSGVSLTSGVDANDIEASQARAAKSNRTRAAVGLNAAGSLDGYKITSFSPTRAIINGPGGSRLVFNEEEVVLGGVPWFVVIQKNGIEFLHQGQRILLLFDRSLSSINRVTASSDSDGDSGGGASSSSSSSSNDGFADGFSDG